MSGWWGDIESYKTDEQIYAATERKALGPTAEVPNTAVRRAQLVFDRAPAGSVEDVATTHLDFMNLTSGNPDETWVTADFTAIEALINTWWAAMRTYFWNGCDLTSIRWYRVGPSIVPPNPPVRILTRTDTGGSTETMPPQIAITVTLRTAVRKEWGRLYLPHPGSNACNFTTGRIASAAQISIANATDTLMENAAIADFLPIVYGPARKKFYSVEKVQVDDLFDVIRSRRWDRPLVREVRT